jgi:hypothetical protein
VTITGTGFSGATAVLFGATAATTFTVNSATQIVAISPASAGTVDVRVSTQGGTSATSAGDQFSYTAAPTVTSISPTSGPAAGSTSVTITGTGFAGTAGAGTVKFGAVNAASYTVNSPTSITAVSPPGTGTVDVTVVNNVQTSTVSAADRFTYQSATTQTTLASSQNPSQFRQPVTFTATVTGTGTPGGKVTFADGGTTIGTATLSAGTANFATSTLAVGNHTITASYGGSTTYAPSTSPALAQTVNIPVDSVRLRALQINVTKMVAQASGQAISGAVDDAIAEAFSENGTLITPGNGRMRINFSAEPIGQDEPGASTGAGGSNGSTFATDGRHGDSQSGRASRSRVDDAFAAINQRMPAKAPPKWQEDKNWLLWADLRGSGLDRWGSSTTPAGVAQASQASIYGQQVNAMMGLTYKATPNVAIGVVGGWENFSYTQQDINGRLKGDGWTTGAYLGWKVAPTLRYDAAVTYSSIGYDGISGTAQGNFNGQRWMFATGLTGTYKAYSFLFEPSARVYALWEHENAYVDSLGTQQGTHDFATGRASGGMKAAYPVAWFDTDILLTPYLGIFGDYYFNQEDVGAILVGGGLPLASTPLLQGWSARATGGLSVRLPDGPGFGVGGELGGIGSSTRIWTLSAKAQVPFGAR